MKAWSAKTLLVSLSAVLLVSAAISGIPTLAAASDTNDKAVARIDSERSHARSIAHELSTAMEEVVEIVRPSVVSISSARRIQSTEQRPLTLSPFGESPLSEFFGGRGFPLPKSQQPLPDVVQRGLGTGVVVSDDGFILTNHHVVRDADQVQVTLPDERMVDAEVIGTDPKTDLAVLKVEASGLQPAHLGDSEGLRVGQMVLAAGNPFGLASTVTSGIISGTGRSRMGITDYEDFIQTDAAINPGNSGGPLINLDGEVVGINTAIFSKSGGHNGIGFAIPINMARSVMESLITDGRIVRGWLGAYIQDLDQDLANSFGFDGTTGVLVGEVISGSPAADAGLQRGDIITRYGDTQIHTSKQLRMDVASTEPQSSVTMSVFRNGDETSVDVTIGELEADESTDTRGHSGSELGITLRNLTPETRRQFSIDDELDGVLVKAVDPLGPAARASIKPNDVILEVQDTAVRSLKEFRDALGEHDLSKGVRLTVRTQGGSRFVFLQVRQ